MTKNLSRKIIWELKKSIRDPESAYMEIFALYHDINKKNEQAKSDLR